MKRILLIVLDILLLVILLICMFSGFSIGKLHIPSFQEIAGYSENLSLQIADANKRSQEYDNMLAKTKTDVESLTKAKKAYLDLLTVSTDSEIQRALQTRSYSIEYVWEKVGLHASEEGVAVKMEITDSSIGDGKHKNLNFSVAGTYLALTNFISNLENDSELEFTIDNFDMIRVSYGDDSETKEECVFIVRDVCIVNEKTTTNNVNEASKLIEPQNQGKSSTSTDTSSTNNDETNGAER